MSRPSRRRRGGRVRAYECQACGHRVHAACALMACPDCGGRLSELPSVPLRE